MEARDEVARPQAQDVPPMVEIDGLNKWFGEVQVLRDVSLSVGRGEKIVICGPAASGKSTLLRCINGLEEPEGGRICVDGIELDGTHRSLDRVRRRIGMVFRQSNLFPHLTVMGNLLLGPMCAHGAEQAALEDRAIAVLERVRLADQRLKYPSQLARGQQQRVAIARALMLAPKVLLFDEPTAALPPEMAGEVFDVIAEIADPATTMLIATQEMPFARTIADRIVYMDRGAIVDMVAPSDVFEAADEDGMQGFLSPPIRH
jgi:general L-amino acid transport system ATP-binding protein